MRVYPYINADDRIGRVRDASTADVPATSPRSVLLIGTQDAHDRPDGRTIGAETGTIVGMGTGIGITGEKGRGRIATGTATGGSDTMTDMTTAIVGDTAMSEGNMSTAITAADRLPDSHPLGTTTAEGTTHRSRSAGTMGDGTMSAGMGEGGRADVVRALTRVPRGDDLDDEI